MVFLPSITSAKDPCHGESRRLRQRYCDIMVLIEKMMERLIGTHCYPCSAAISKTRMPGDGRIKNGWVSFNKEVIRKDLVLPEFSGGSKVDPTLVYNEEIPYRWSEYLCHVGCSRQMHSIDCRRKRCKRGMTNSILHRPGSHER